MSSDKDSAAPSRIWYSAPNYACVRSGCTSKHDGVYIRDDGDLISRSAVVKRLREVARVHDAKTMVYPPVGEQANYCFGIKQLANALADEFEKGKSNE